ncbi:MAG: hypothetical protein HZA53_05095 [Planctomycetes bacterium]|nr:hypothetical protein [Planctomycetota bacterium]
MIPHEKALVERMKNEPFALVGINTDTDKDEYRKQQKKHGVTWRSSWQGSTRGALPTEWGVSGFPTLYLVDHKGVIRKVWVGTPDKEEDLDQLVDELVQAAKADRPPAPAKPEPKPSDPKKKG